MSLYRFLKRFDWFNWIRFRTWDKHHVLKLRYLTPGWTDKDEVLIHAMFEVLCNFIQNERPQEIVDWDADEEHRIAWKEIMELRIWWESRLTREGKNPILQSGIKSPEMKAIPIKETSVNPITKKEEALSKLEFVHNSDEDKAKWEKACTDCGQWERDCFDEDTEMMIRLIRVRHFLWT